MRTVGLAVALASTTTLVGFGVLGSSSLASAGTVKGLLSTHVGFRATTESWSDNWGGYAVTPNTGDEITGVQGNWVVPAVSYLPPGFSASWVGIGGYTTSDLIQAGTASQTLPLAGGQYYAWYEELPGDEVQLTNCTGNSACTVEPGDQISTSVKQVSPGGNFVITEADPTEGWTWNSGTLAYPSSTYSSAEWIFEAPSFDGAQTIPIKATAEFDGAETFETNGGPAEPIQTATDVPYAINEGVGLDPLNLSIPSTLVNDQEFNVCSYDLTTCAAP